MMDEREVGALAGRLEARELEAKGLAAAPVATSG